MKEEVLTCTENPHNPDIGQGACQANVFPSLYQVSKHNYYIVLKSQELEEEKHLGKSWR